MVTEFNEFFAKRGYKVPDELVKEFVKNPVPGENVRVLRRKLGHEFYIGEIITIVKQDDKDSFMCTNGLDAWWLSRSEFEKI